MGPEPSDRCPYKERETEGVPWWLGLSALTVEGPGSIPRQGTKIPHPTSRTMTWPKKKEENFKKIKTRTSLVAQWLRICLPIQGTRVRALVREDPTGHRATKPVHHNY